jgi:hypothetical protein
MVDVTESLRKEVDALKEKLAATEQQLENNRGHRIDNDTFMQWKAKVDSARQNERLAKDQVEEHKKARDQAVQALGLEQLQRQKERADWEAKQTRWEKEKSGLKETTAQKQTRIEELEKLLAEKDKGTVKAVVRKPKSVVKKQTTTKCTQTEEYSPPVDQSQLDGLRAQINKLLADRQAMSETVKSLQAALRKAEHQNAPTVRVEEDVDHQILLMEVAELRSIFDSVGVPSKNRPHELSSSAWDDVVSAGLLSALVGVKQRAIALKEQHNQLLFSREKKQQKPHRPPGSGRSRANQPHQQMRKPMPGQQNWKSKKGATGQQMRRLSAGNSQSARVGSQLAPPI